MGTAQLSREDLFAVLTDDTAFEAYAAAYSPEGERTPENVAACAMVLRSVRARSDAQPATAPRRSPRRWGSRAARRAAGERSGNDPGDEPDGVRSEL